MQRAGGQATLEGGRIFEGDKSETFLGMRADAVSDEAVRHPPEFRKERPDNVNSGELWQVAHEDFCVLRLAADGEDSLWSVLQSAKRISKLKHQLHTYFRRDPV